MYGKGHDKVQGLIMNPDIGTSTKFFKERRYGDIMHFLADCHGNYKNTITDPFV
jgi:hypothetical protein